MITKILLQNITASIKGARLAFFLLNQMFNFILMKELMTKTNLYLEIKDSIH